MLPLPFLFLMLCGSRGAVKGTSPVPTELTVLQGDSISQALAGGGGSLGVLHAGTAALGRAPHPAVL